MNNTTKILLTIALLNVSLTAVVLHNSSTLFLLLFIGFALAEYHHNSKFYRGTL
jgi:hypothetical protein